MLRILCQQHVNIGKVLRKIEEKNHTSTQNETIDISGAPEERGLSGFDTQRTYWRQEENSE